MPISAPKIFGAPVVHTFSPTMIVSVIAATAYEAAPGGSAKPMPKILRKPSRPIVKPIIATTKPAISGGKNGRSGRSTRDTVISTAPANIVMPNISGKPPAFSASNDAGRYAAANIGGHRKPEPTGPQRNACRIGPMAITSIDRLNTSRIFSPDMPACRQAITGTNRKIATRPTCCTPLNNSTPRGGLSFTP